MTNEEREKRLEAATQALKTLVTDVWGSAHWRTNARVQALRVLKAANCAVPVGDYEWAPPKGLYPVEALERRVEKLEELAYASEKRKRGR